MRISTYIQLDPEASLAGKITNTIDAQLAWLEGVAPKAFLAIVFVIGVWLLISSKGNLRKVIVLGLAAAVAYLVLKNISWFSDLFRSEIIGGQPKPHTTVDTDIRRWA